MWRSTANFCYENANRKNGLTYRVESIYRFSYIPASLSNGGFAMAGLTPFGIAIRKLRLDKRMRLLDLGERLNKSAAYLSAIETGRKPIPDGFVLDVARAMRLSTEELSALRKAADRTRKHVAIERLPEDQREIVAAFARRIDKVPENILAELRKIIMKSITGEQPFQRHRRGIVVPPLSTSAIRSFAEKVRSVFVDEDQIEFPIMNVIEFKLEMILDGFYLDVRDAESMSDDEGRLMVTGKGIALALREDVYLGAWGGNGRDRFTASHEVAHLLMHRAVTMPRMREDHEKIFIDAEWQADTFAGTLLMSPRHLDRFSDSDHAAKLCGMTGAAAHVMWAKYREENRFPDAAEMSRFSFPQQGGGNANP
jgi:Zn-dependent peptidase ImmA (M78 family)/transcriptional regulator with XRE-family HTH domain